MRTFLALPLLAALAAAPEPAAVATLGNAAPPFAARTLDGAHVSGVAPGTVTVLNFWATWCPPCRAETAGLATAYRRLHAKDVAFLGIDTTETAPIVKTFVSAKGVPFPVALAGGDVYNAFGVVAIPTTVVVDASGIVRARWTGEITPAQLTQYVAAAGAGRSSTFVSPEQAQIDKLLALDAYHFDDPEQREDALRDAFLALAATDKLADDDAAHIDYERTSHAEGRLRIAAGTAERDAATTAKGRIAGFLLIANGQSDLGRFDQAAQTYRTALELAPSSPELVEDLAKSYYRLHDYVRMISVARRYTQLRPGDGDGWSWLGLGYQRARRFHDAVPAYRRSLAIFRANAAAHPTQPAIADVADTSLDLADVYVALGDVDGVKATFAQANAYGDRLGATGTYARLKRNVKERTQEGLVAVALAGVAARVPVVSIAPWTGPDLPGSVASTLKYRLIVASPANRTVTLRATGLRRDWVASFCADGLCSPQTVSFAAPPSGVKTYEFQLVPPQNGARPGSVGIAVTGGRPVSVPSLRAAVQ